MARTSVWTHWSPGEVVQGRKDSRTAEYRLSLISERREPHSALRHPLYGYPLVARPHITAVPSASRGGVIFASNTSYAFLRDPSCICCTLCLPHHEPRQHKSESWLDKHLEHFSTRFLADLTQQGLLPPRRQAVFPPSLPNFAAGHQRRFAVNSVQPRTQHT